MNINSNEDAKKLDITKNEITKILTQSINDIKKYMIDNKISVDTLDDTDVYVNHPNVKSKTKTQKSSKNKNRHSISFYNKRHPILENSFDKVIEEIILIVKSVTRINLFESIRSVQSILIKGLNLENNPRLKYLFIKAENLKPFKIKNFSENEIEENKQNALIQANIALSNQDQRASMLVYQIEENLYYTILNFIILISNFNPIESFENKNLINNNSVLQNKSIEIIHNNTSKSLISDYHREMIKFNLNIINLIIFAYQRRNKVQMISEYYIEKYLKDVLEVLTSKNFNLEIKSDFLLATITFVSYFDGYESILFQNGLFHSILSDLTSTKLEESPLEVLSFS